MRTNLEIFGDLQFSIGDIVFHRTVEDREPGLVTGLIVRDYGTAYYVTWGDRNEKVHYDYELSKEFDFIGSLQNDSNVVEK